MSHDPFCLYRKNIARSEYEMSFKATEFTAHFNSKYIDMYTAKLKGGVCNFSKSF